MVCLAASLWRPHRHVAAEGLVEVQEVLGQAEGAAGVLVALQEGVPDAHQPGLDLQGWQGMLVINNRESNAYFTQLDSHLIRHDKSEVLYIEIIDIFHCLTQSQALFSRLKILLISAHVDTHTTVVTLASHSLSVPWSCLTHFQTHADVPVRTPHSNCSCFGSCDTQFT